MEDYTVTVKFFRCGGDDHPFLEARVRDGSTSTEAKAEQLTAELQEAYDSLDCSIAGGFKVVEVDGEPFVSGSERKRELQKSIHGKVESLTLEELDQLFVQLSKAKS